MVRRLACALALLLLLLPTAVSAAGLVDTGEIERALPDDARRQMGDASPTSFDASAGASSLWSGAVDIFRGYLRHAMASGFLILGLCALLSIATGFAKAAGIGVSEKVIDITAVCAILTICLSLSGSVLTECARAINDLNTFSNILIPGFGVAMALAGKPVTAVASTGATLVFGKLIITLAKTVFIPSLYLYITTVAAGAMISNPLMDRVAGFIKWISSAFFRGFLMVFTGYIAISGVITGSADTVAVKTAQVTISGVVPVVGGIISGVSESLLAGAAALRASIGIFGFLGACAICLAPFVKALCSLLVFKLLAAFSSSFAGGAAAKLLDGISTAYGIALGLLGTCCAVQFISIVVSMVVANA